MKLVIIPIDGAVYVDGYSYSGLDLSIAPSNVHALQWKNDKGWIEFKDNDDGTKPQNQPITELPEWANACKVKWDDAKSAEEIARMQAEEQARLAAEEETQVEGDM